MRNLYYMKVESSIIPQVFYQMLLFLPHEIREKLNHLHSDIDKKLYIYSQLMVRGLLGKILETSGSSLTFDKLKYGKPIIKGYPSLYYNLSHTQKAILLGIWDCQLGVDIERIKTPEVNIAKKFFTVNEYKYVTQTLLDLDKRFYEVWTKKEAYTKMIGRGLLTTFNSFDVFNKNIASTLYTYERDGYILSICSIGLSANVAICEITEETMYKLAHTFLF